MAGSSFLSVNIEEKCSRTFRSSYLLWVLDLPDLYPRTRTAIEKFLEQQS